MPLEKCRFITFPKIHDDRGNLTFVQGHDQIPFEIKRIYYMYDIPDGKSRGGHAHIETEQVLIAIHGSFEVRVDDGVNQKFFQLNRPDQGLYVPTMLWRELKNFSAHAVCLSIVSTLFAEGDYIRSYEEFKKRTLS